MPVIYRVIMSFHTITLLFPFFFLTEAISLDEEYDNVRVIVTGGILFPKSGGIVFPTWPHNPIHIIREACEQRVPASAVLSGGSCRL